MTMDYARQQRDPMRHMIGIVFVVAVHVLVIYALASGLARQALLIAKKPLDATIIEEIKLPPPPPPPPKRVDQPPPPPPPDTYVPQPDIPVTTAVTGPTITVVTPEPPKAPAPVVEAPKPPPPKPAIRRGGQLEIVAREPMNFPREAERAGVEKGTVVARMQIDGDGNVTDVQIMSSDPPRVFDKEVRRGLSMWKFKADGEKYVAEIEIGFKLQ
jgi:periplasmic protein TonB